MGLAPSQPGPAATATATSAFQNHRDGMRSMIRPGAMKTQLGLLALALALVVVDETGAAAQPSVHVLPVADLKPGERRPLLLFLHGLGGSGEEALADPGLRRMAAAGRMVLVAPDGAMDRAGRRFWNASGACCNFDRRAVDDITRLEKLIDEWRARPDIDPERVYIVGFSNGGFMAHRLACWMDERLAAIVSIAGAGRRKEEACAVSTSIAVLEVHGDADNIVRHGGGRVFDSRELDPHPSAPETIRDWAERLGCLAERPPTTKTIDVDSRLPGAETTVLAYAGCPRGAAELWTVQGGGHPLVTPEVLAKAGEFLAAHPKAAAVEKKKTKPSKRRRSE
jgi:polyhydroxybutyrate depolymerase